MTPSPNELSRTDESRHGDLRSGQSRDQRGGSRSPGAEPDRAREAQSWVFAFVLFLLGFLLLIVLAKLKISRFTADVLRGLAAGLCVVGFLIARRGQRAPR